jgi:predicted transcriptional regulator
MSRITDEDIDELLVNWYTTKEEVLKLEKSIEKYRKLAKRIMSKTGENVIESGNLKVSRQEITRRTISKIDVPVEIWDRYSKVCNYDTYSIKKSK